MVLGLGLLPLEIEARPSKHKVDNVNPEVRAIVEYILKNPATIVNTEPVYAFTAENCWQKRGNAGCSKSGTRNIHYYKFILDEQEVSVSYQDLDSTRIHSDGKISPEDNLSVFQRRNLHQSFPSFTRFTDERLDGTVDNSCSLFLKEEISLESDYATQKAYESVLKDVGKYIFQHPLKK